MTELRSLQELIDEHLAALAGLYQLVDGRRPTGEPLTERELQVVTLAVATPLSNKEIGRKLFLSVDTVKTHMSAAFRKLGVSRRHQLALVLALAGGAS
jgi:ATP/maltotriose-dependent transcriptional regulator MalT